MPPAPLLIREMVGEVMYEYAPLGQYIVVAPGVCGGRPTFKYTRLEVAVVLDLIAAGWTQERLLQEYAYSRLTPQAVAEAVHLAREALVSTVSLTATTA